MSFTFDSQKKESLSGIDWSRKGSVDAPIHDLIAYLNSLNDFFTTSSCSGRIVVFSEGETKKKGCNWFLTSHDVINASDVLDVLKDQHGSEQIITFKYECFILHVQCRTLESAQNMLKVALESGYRNSGIVLGKKKKYMLAVRSTHGLEVPLKFSKSVVVSTEYVAHLADISNKKLQENFTRIERFFQNIKKSFLKP